MATNGPKQARKSAEDELVEALMTWHKSRASSEAVVAAIKRLIRENPPMQTAVIG